MKNYLKNKLYLLLLTIFSVSMTVICFCPSQVYARKPEEKENLPQTPSNITAQYYIVSLDGLGDFTSIQEAVNHAKDGDTLIIYPGIYMENVEIFNKSLHIIGIDKNSCILQYNTASYFKVPLTIAAGSVSNLTIYGIHFEDLSTDDSSTVLETPPILPPISLEESLAAEENANLQIRMEIWNHQKNHTGYAIHIDDHFSYGKEIKFRNCKIISENNHCVGLGSRGNSTINFEDCEFISTGNGGCIYLHDCELSEYQGDVNFTMKNCQLTSYLNPYIMTIESLGSFNPTYMTFQNVMVRSVAYNESECYVPNNINTSFDVDTLLYLDQAGQLETIGLTSTAMHNIVHELTPEDSHLYIEKINTLFEHKDSTIDYNILPEGITYIKSSTKTNLNFDINHNFKKSVLNFQNAGNQVGIGWYGLDNVYLTPDSYGNTLIEMNSTHLNGLSQ